MSKSAAAEKDVKNLKEYKRSWCMSRPPKTPIKKPEIVPFDLQKCLNQIQYSYNGRLVLWDKSSKPIKWSKDEATFWFNACSVLVPAIASARTYISELENKQDAVFDSTMNNVDYQTAMDEYEKFNETLPGLYNEAIAPVVKRISLELTEEVDKERIEEYLKLVTGPSLPELIEWDQHFSPVFRLLTWTESTELMCKYDQGLFEFVNDYLPTLEEHELNEVKEVVRKVIEAEDSAAAAAKIGEPETEYEPVRYRLAAHLGMADLVERVVESWKDGLFEERINYYAPSHVEFQPIYIVLGLQEPEKIAHHIRRLKILIETLDQCIDVVTATQDRLHDLISKQVVQRSLLPSYSRSESLDKSILKLLTELDSNTSVAQILPIHMKVRHLRGKTRDWFLENPSRTVGQMLTLLDSDCDKESRAEVERILKDIRLARSDSLDAALLEALEKRLGPSSEDSPELTDEDTPPWLAEFSSISDKSGPLPSWAVPTLLKPIRIPVAGPSEEAPVRRLNSKQMETLLIALRSSKLDFKHKLIAAFQENVSRDACDSFAWDLFERWMAEGAPPKDKWAMTAIGFLGSNQSALNLTPLIRKWPGEAQHARAALGLECLAEIGTDTALMCIHGIAEKAKFKGIKATAATCMERLAKDRELTRAELEDRIIPTCQLDDNGTRIFDFGPRQFRLVIGPELQVMLKDQNGKLLRALPKPNSKDDSEASANATKEWKQVKQKVSEIAKIQSLRLEQGMVTGRTWTVQEFESFLVNHPLMINLVRSILWQTVPEDGNEPSTFRVAEDKSFANSRDEAMLLDGTTKIRVAHPLNLSKDELQAWGEVFSDYELAQPFQQLGRPSFKLNDDEMLDTSISKMGGRRISTYSVLSGMDQSGWQRGAPGDAGYIQYFTKTFPSIEMNAYIEIDPGFSVSYLENEDQEVTGCYFAKTGDNWNLHQVPLGNIDPTVISEVLYDLEKLSGKASEPEYNASPSAQDKEESRIATCRQLLEDRRFKEALTAAEKLTELYPDSKEAWDCKGEALMRLGRAEEAIEAYDKITPGSVNEWEIWCTKGIALYEDERYEEALPAFDKALSIKQEPQYYINKVLALLALERTEEAVQICDQAIAVDTTLGEAWNLKGTALFRLERYDEAAAAQEKAVELEDSEFRYWENLADTYVETKNLERAAECFEQAGIHERDVRHYLSQTSCLLELNAIEDAFHAIQYATWIDPENYHAWCMKGDISTLQGRYKQAIQSFDKAIKLDRDQALAWHGKVLALQELGLMEEAISLCETMIKLEPTRTAGLSLKGCVLNAMGQFEQALECFGETVDEQPDIEYHWHNKASTLLVLRRFSEALEAAKTAVELCSELPGSLTIKAVILQCLNRHEEAQEFLEKAREKFNDSARTEASIGDTKFSAGLYEEAEQHLNNAIELNSGEAEYWFIRACCNCALGDRKKATADLKQAIKLDKRYKVRAEYDVFVADLKKK